MRALAVRSLTARGEDNGRRLGQRLQGLRFSRVFTSPLQRARRTCELAGFTDVAEIDPDLMEWNYGAYEGIPARVIRERSPDWVIFRHGCPGGETAEQVGLRADRVIKRARDSDGDVALFAHGHVLRVLAARWIGFPVGAGERFLLDTGTLCVLGYYRDTPALDVWNGPILG